MDQKISQLEEMTEMPTKGDWIPIVDNINNKNMKIDISKIIELKGTNIIDHTSDGVEILSGQGFFVDTSVSTMTLFLPLNPEIGDKVGVCDYADTFSINQLVLDGNGQNIQRTSETLGMNRNGAAISLVFVDPTEGGKMTNFNIPWR